MGLDSVVLVMAFEEAFQIERDEILPRSMSCGRHPV